MVVSGYRVSGSGAASTARSQAQPSWRFDVTKVPYVPSYQAIHKRLFHHRGRAGDRLCVYCEAPAQGWALAGEAKWCDKRGRRYTDDLNAYIPLCQSCHRQLDRTPCPHGPNYVRLPDGACKACARERRKERYTNDPAYRERLLAKRRESYALQKTEVDSNAVDALE